MISTNYLPCLDFSLKGDGEFGESWKDIRKEIDMTKFLLYFCFIFALGSVVLEGGSEG